jgi:uncharacterized protein (DUF2126 family)/transglutaminase-like putative cysteine protease
MLRVALTHRTKYRYDRPVTLGPQTIRLRPAPHARTPIEAYSLQVEPAGHFLNWLQDPHGNWLARVVFPDPVERFEVTVDLVAEMVVINPFDFFLEPYAETFPFAYDDALAQALAPYLRVPPATPRLARWIEGVPREEAATVGFLVALNQRLQGDIEYLIRMEPGVQAPEETLEKASGSCRDSAWLLVHILRHLGLAARFVSGYLIQLVPDVESLDGPSGPKADFTDLHAWAEVYIPGAGWVGLDPTSGLVAGEGHIPVACTPAPQTAAPIDGALDECEVSFDFAMQVQRVAESPRVTKPYSEAQWQAIDALGEHLDGRIEASDMRLTMGGEPTFVALDDPDGEEWHTAAVGPTKRRLGMELAQRLRARYATDGLLHYGQGKWYPGEPLPRWALAVYWREDGVPLWRDPTLVASDPEPRLEVDDARRFGEELARQLGVSERFLVPAYEDPVAAVVDEQALPENLAPGDPRLDDPIERARFARVWAGVLSKPTGFVLPLQPWQARDGVRWRSERWPLRRGALVLAPGQSPVGLRLPLKSLPWFAEGDLADVDARVPFTRQPRLPEPREAPIEPVSERADADASGARPDEMGPGDGLGAGGSSAPWPVRTALAVEVRDGYLCVFVPPLDSAEAFVSLLDGVERTARELGQPVHVEGYKPPHDHRLRHLEVTPDPGVIEVNVQPAASWRELVANTTSLYEEARLSRLVTEKFLLDGRHTGTGGGNHIVVGGATPADSPFLRRPDLLRSLITYWQHHPSLSYLFSGLFIGPTSQAPRVDEARHDALDELELAFAQLPEPGEAVAPWVVDRVLRNLLVDVTGNTHRTEICIDKLYSPTGPTGRLGLVELRAFEMPPHARMSLAQALLLRAILVRLWEAPYRARLIRWGTRLHDRFLLPHWIGADFAEVVADLRAHGIPVEAEWFAPHHEFRFPVHGRTRCGGIELELRQALEPWPALGEEAVAGGTARYVDSSIERLQVLVTHWSPERYVLSCNGAAVPLEATEVAGEAVGGVRYRAWHPAFCLHPTIGVHTPLRFDIYDRYSRRSLGGCTYHVAHPGGRNFERFPINALEAEGRRLARFEPQGHFPGPMEEPHPHFAPSHPATLDLRWVSAAQRRP